MESLFQNDPPAVADVSGSQRGLEWPCLEALAVRMVPTEGHHYRDWLMRQSPEGRHHQIQRRDVRHTSL